MDLSFGARLRLQREKQQVALADIAEQTKIKLSLLEGLERDDVSHWPGGIFSRSYIRAYAQAIGLKPDTLVREFLELHPDPVEDIPTVLAAARGTASARRGPPTRLRFLIGSAIGALPTLRLYSEQSGGPAAEKVAAADSDSSVERQPLRVERDPPAVSPVKLAVANGDASVHDEPRGGERDVSAVVPAPAAPAASHSEASPDKTPFDGALSAMAHLCTRLACAAEPREVTPVLEDAVRLVDAVGLIVWIWDPQRSALQPVLCLGYSNDVVAQLTGVRSDTDNAIAAAFRSAEIRVVNGDALETGAVVVPLQTPAGCAGVLALELRNGGERRDSVRAFATILAAQLSTLIACPSLEELAPESPDYVLRAR